MKSASAPQKDIVAFPETISKLVRNGAYDIECPGGVEGVSGVRHDVDLFCNYGGGNLLVDVRKGNDGVVPVLALYTKVLDSKCSRGVLITVPRASSLARRLSRDYGLTLVEAESPDDAAVSLGKVIAAARSSQALIARVNSDEVGGG